MLTFRTVLAMAVALLLTAFFLLFYRPHLIVSIIFPIALAIKVGRFPPNKLPMLSGVLVFAANTLYVFLQGPALAGTDLLLAATVGVGITAFFGAILGLLVEAALGWLEKFGPTIQP